MDPGWTDPLLSRFLRQSAPHSRDTGRRNGCLAVSGQASERKVMRKTLILVTALAVLVALATPAVGKGKPQDPDPPTTADCKTNDAGLLLGSDGQPFVAESGLIKFECLWTPAESATDVGTVTVEATEGSISGVVVFVRDDSPGDICVLEQDWDGQTGPSYTASFDLAYGPLNEPFSDYSGQTYWTWDSGQWCYPQDGDFNMREDSNGKPLHLRADFRAKKGTTVEITLFPPQATTP